MAFSFQARGFQRALSPEAPSQEAVHSPCTHSGQRWGQGWSSDSEDPSQAPPLGWGTPAPTVAVPHGARLMRGGAGRQAGSLELTAEGAGGAARRPVHCGLVVPGTAGPRPGRALQEAGPWTPWLGASVPKSPHACSGGASTSSLCPELPPGPRGPRVRSVALSLSLECTPRAGGTGRWLC